MMDANTSTPVLESTLTQTASSAIDPILVIALTCLVGITMVVFALLRAWQDWLARKNRELENQTTQAGDSEPNSQMSVGAARIELADMKERIKKLEAIASGVEL